MGVLNLRVVNVILYRSCFVIATSFVNRYLIPAHEIPVGREKKTKKMGGEE